MSDSSGSGLPDGLIAYGPDANCTLDICPVEWSVLEYQPSLAASGVFIALFGISMIIHIFQGIRLRSWGYMTCMILGCIDEMIGYGGRIMLNPNPFSFDGFLIQIICITTGPVFFCAAIYVTLSRTIQHLDVSISRFNPRLLYWTFIPFDIVSLALQAGGGAASSTSSGSNQSGVDVSLAGLSIQVITLVVFIVLASDYLIRYYRLPNRPKMEQRVQIFLTFLSLAILFILIRCAYRIAELQDGYGGALIHNEGEFYGLESAMVTLAVFCLNVSQPNWALKGDNKVLSPADEEVAKDEFKSYQGDVPGNDTA